MISKYHHGSSAVYDTIVRMAQDFSLRHAAGGWPGQLRLCGWRQRRSHAIPPRFAWQPKCPRCWPTSTKEAVNFGPSFRPVRKGRVMYQHASPTCWSAAQGGIAVGMAWHIHHSLNAIIDACLHLLRNPESGHRRLFDHASTDFPTAGIILASTVCP
ncbi:MAG: DNA gyrase subunit A [Burkholderiaceae bacterium]